MKERKKTNKLNLQTLILASNNQDKLNELQAQLSPFHIILKTQRDYQIESIEETGLSFVENALLKARHVTKLTGLPALADDSGLIVAALNGSPGLFSARYAGEKATDGANNAKLLSALSNVSKHERDAYFYCCLVLLMHEYDPNPVIVEAKWHGRILLTPRGDHGFGYDPIFYLPDYDCSSAELSPQLKNRISHRAQAVAKLCRYFRGC